MLTVAKYYAAALFLTAVGFLGFATTSPAGYADVLASWMSHPAGPAETIRVVLNTWLIAAAQVAFLGFVFSLAFTRASTTVGAIGAPVAVPGRGAGANQVRQDEKPQ